MTSPKGWLPPSDDYVPPTREQMHDLARRIHEVGTKDPAKMTRLRSVAAICGDSAAQLAELLSDPQVGDVIEVRYEDAQWTADVAIECPRCKHNTERSLWVATKTLPDLLRELVRVIEARRDELQDQCPAEGHR